MKKLFIALLLGMACLCVSVTSCKQKAEEATVFTEEEAPPAEETLPPAEEEISPLEEETPYAE